MRQTDVDILTDCVCVCVTSVRSKQENRVNYTDMSHSVLKTGLSNKSSTTSVRYLFAPTPNITQNLCLSASATLSSLSSSSAAALVLQTLVGITQKSRT